MPVLIALLGALFGIGGTLGIQQLLPKEPVPKPGEPGAPRRPEQEFLMLFVDNNGNVIGQLFDTENPALDAARGISSPEIAAIVASVQNGIIGQQRVTAVFGNSVVPGVQIALPVTTAITPLIF